MICKKTALLLGVSAVALAISAANPDPARAAGTTITQDYGHTYNTVGANDFFTNPSFNIVAPVGDGVFANGSIAGNVTNGGNISGASWA